jgi:RNA polymerase sigma-70 factor (ECF subfamily)
MYGLCLQYSKNPDEAKDILQDGFVKVFKNLVQYSYSGSFEGWVRKIFVNTAIESFRNKKMKFSDMEIQAYSEDFSFDSIVSEISAQEILAIVQDLSPQYRMVFNLYAIEGYTHKEIAEKLNISEGTSKSNLSRARSILQERVKEIMPVYQDSLSGI